MKNYKGLIVCGKQVGLNRLRSHILREKRIKLRNDVENGLNKDSLGRR